MNCKNHIFYSAKTQYENLGDSIINRELLSSLRCFGTLMVDCSDVPEWFIKEIGILPDEIYKSSKMQSFALVILWEVLTNLFISQNRFYLILTPGHLYGSLTAIEVAKLLYFSILKVLGVRICRFGVSIGPYSKAMRFVEVLKSKAMYSYTVRDTLSQLYAQRQVGVCNVKLFPDLSWMMEPKIPDKSFLFNEPYLVFSFRESTFSNQASTDYRSRLLSVLEKIVEILSEKHCYRLVFCYQVSHDKSFCEDIKCVLQEKLPDKVEIVFIEDRLNLDYACQVYSGADFVFSNRLHVLMLAMRFNSIAVPVLNSEKHTKITGLFNDVGWQDLLIDLNWSSVQINSKLDDIYSQISELKKINQDIFKKRKDEARSIILSVFNGI